MTTPCPEWENLISEYLDGELSEADRPRVEQHLFQCKSCGEYFQGAKADTATVAAAFAGLPRVCPKGFAARVMQRIRRPGTRRRKLGWVGIAVAASVLVALLVGRPASIGSVTRLIDGTGIAAAGGVELTQPEKPSTAVEQGT
ncbi:MAG TPA: zf-HC2 domain-containing protein, partial [Planctomycetota bacterium]|nr:zf-HC2 domain-containing protein [Planctomycetota bacterium]